METQIWFKSEEKWAYILVLRGHEISYLKVTGNVLTLKKNLQNTLEALQQGQNPAEVGAKVVQTLDARALTKAEVSPGNSHLTLHGGPDGSTRLIHTTADDNADAILQAIVAQSGKTFQPAQEEIGVGEALIPPVLFGAVGGVVWWLVYNAAGKMAGGENVEVHGFRRRGLQRILITAAQFLGTGGTIAVGVVLLLLIVAWAANRIIHRPERTVWLPDQP